MLPKGVPMDYNQQNKPIQARVPPSRFVQGTGIPALNSSLDVSPERKREIFVLSSDHCGSVASTSKSQPTKTPTPVLVQHEKLNTSSFEVGEDSGEDNLSVRIELFIFPPQNYQTTRQRRHSGQQGAFDEEPAQISLVMVRTRCEPVTQCIKRMELSLAKKLKPVFLDEGKISQNVRKEKVCKEGLQKLDVSAFLLQGDKLARLEETDMGTMTTEAFFRLRPSQSIQIIVQVDNNFVAEIPIKIECNPPTIVSVQTFEKFHSKIFPEVPLVVEVETIHATGAVIDWYVGQNLVCHKSSCFTPTFGLAKKSIGIVITPYRDDHTGRGFEEAYEFTEKVEENLPENATLQARQNWLTMAPKELRVMSYNVLADQNAYSISEGQPFFPWVSADTLNRARRMPLILHEMLSHRADLICLQEVDELVYETLFRPCMRCFNYQGYYQGKKSNGTKEGCAIFFSLSKFEVTSESNLTAFGISELLIKEIPYLQPGDWNDCAQPVVDLLARTPDLKSVIQHQLGHILQVAHLRDKRGYQLLVANTHLFYHPAASHIRALQCFAIAYKLSEEQRDMGDVPFILCGDFNSEIWNCPRLFTQHQTQQNFCIPEVTDWQKDLNTFNFFKDNEEPCSPEFHNDFPSLQLPKNFPEIISGYPEYPELTHYVLGFQATLDHILMTRSSSQGSLTPFRQAPIPSLDSITRDVAMPSKRFPSDQISLVSDISWQRKIKT
ncbi:endonuclease/exonuclease/phosphatase family protein [Nitzschia inconspicua]|uniref:Endonuclease/exonuclease/phosphatase family protein n=1 Tax=Nitzschia inconspicua TaxID=303405 RepID=A0A9K3Q1S0_9STRA|nr:endonuclease/exonuclease/phosphatase family protein [Nitzschia inconspicua]